MNSISRILTVSLLFSIPFAAFSQKAEPKAQEPARSAGLKKVAGRRGADVYINQKQLNADIEKAVEMAMASLEASLQQLEHLELNLEPIQIDIPEFDIDRHWGDINLEPIVIDIPDPDSYRIDIDIEPIEIDLGNLNIELEKLELELDNLDLELERLTSMMNGLTNTTMKVMLTTTQKIQR